MKIIIFVFFSYVLSADFINKCKSATKSLVPSLSQLSKKLFQLDCRLSSDSEFIKWIKKLPWDENLPRKIQENLNLNKIDSEKIERGKVHYCIQKIQALQESFNIRELDFVHLQLLKLLQKDLEMEAQTNFHQYATDFDRGLFELDFDISKEEDVLFQIRTTHKSLHTEEKTQKRKELVNKIDEISEDPMRTQLILSWITQTFDSTSQFLIQETLDGIPGHDSQFRRKIRIKRVGLSIITEVFINYKIRVEEEGGELRQTNSVLSHRLLELRLDTGQSFEEFTFTPQTGEKFKFKVSR